MMQLLKGISPKGWLDLSQKLGVSGVLLYMAWHFGNRLMDNDAAFRNSIVDSQRDAAKAMQSIDGAMRGVAQQERRQSDLMTQQEKSRIDREKHFHDAEKFMAEVVDHEAKQTTAVELLTKEKAKQTVTLEAILKEISPKAEGKN